LSALNCGLAVYPEGISFKHILGVGLLAGIGFTMSIFISILSFSDALHINEAKLSILLTSLLAGILGYMVLSVFGKKISV
jgi:Na+:H+ antiporter, NhaA family